MTEPVPPPAAGAGIPGPADPFTLEVRVPYAHVDAMGVVYYAHYFVYFEMARAHLMREAGLPYGELERRGVMLPVVAAHCDYRRPARFDDRLEIRMPLVEWRGMRLRIEYEVTRGDETLVTGYSEHVCVSKEGRLLRPLPELRRFAELRRP